MKAKKSTKKPKIKETYSYLIVCRNCKIQIILKKEDATKCAVCESTNISCEPWR